MNIVEAIKELQDAVHLLAKQLHRAARLDRKWPRLNAISVINSHAFQNLTAGHDAFDGYTNQGFVFLTD
ncbi:hypothetical protein BJX99DRAFT_235709 [Aspergillus californicus]